MMEIGCHEREHILGTAFIVHKRLKHLVIGFKPISPRLSVLRIKGRFFNISLINVHAPTEDKSDVEKDEFYSALEDAYDKCPKNDIKIIVGDLNAKIGRESRYQPHIGKYSLHKESNKNGDRAIGFAASKNMIIGSTKFNHKDVQKPTWVSPDGQTLDQIDHVLIDARHASNLLDSMKSKTCQILKSGIDAETP
ncbi:craniofacial development protein 2-like [Temnothorax nylanderi]|uniref:craniofacial development protein 2-like n=1 Tax=Temnothorax nylanderi TaxID=102681 RepID=UPI003A8C5D2A